MTVRYELLENITDRKHIKTVLIPAGKIYCSPLEISHDFKNKGVIENRWHDIHFVSETPTEMTAKYRRFPSKGVTQIVKFKKHFEDLGACNDLTGD